MRICHFQAQNGPLIINKLFLVQTIIITFIYLLALLSVQNLKKSYSISRVMRMHNFWTQKDPFAPNNFFFLENYYYHSHLHISPFHRETFLKTSSSRSRVMRMHNFWDQNTPICPEQNFFCTNHYYYFHLPIGPFHWAKFKKILTADPEL